MSEPLNEKSLLNQLETIHKRLNAETDKSESEDISSLNEVDVRSGRKRHSMFSGLLGRNDKNSSLPVFAGSSSHQGVVATNSGQDMDFVMGLSENLLLECRKLQAEAKGKSKALSDLKQDYEQLQEDFDGLNSVCVLNVSELESLQNSNVKLESNLQNTALEVESMKKLVTKKEDEIQNQSRNTEGLKLSLNAQVASLKEEIGSLKEKHVEEIEGLRKTLTRPEESNGIARDSEYSLDKQFPDYIVQESVEYVTLRNELREAHKEIDQLTQELMDATNTSSFDDDGESLKKDSHKTGRITRNLSIFNAFENENIIALPNDDSFEKVNEQPSATEEVIGKLESIGYRVLSCTEYKDIQDKLSSLNSNSKGMESPLPEMIKRIEEYGYFVLDAATYHKLEASTQDSNLDQIQKHLELSGMVAISQEDLKRLSTKENSLESVSDSSKKFEQLEKRINFPTKNEVEDQATKLGYAMLPKMKVDELESIADHPSVEFLEKKAESMGYHMINSQKFEEFTSSAMIPSLEKISEFAVSHGCVLVHSKNILKNNVVDTEAQKSLLEGGSFVLLDKTSYDAILEGDLNKINKSEVIKLCSKFDLIPLTAAKYEDLTKLPDIDRINSFAARNASVVITRENYEILKSEADYPTEEAVKKYAEQNGLSLVNRSEHLAMVEKIDHPSKHYLEKQADKLGLAIVSIDNYNTLLKEINDRSVPTTPSNASKVFASKQYFEEVIRNENGKPEKILESTKILGFVTLSNDEYRTLKENQKDRVMTKTDVYHGAKSYDLTVIPNEEYRALLKKKSGIDNPEFNDLETMAARFDMRMVPLNVKGVESPTPHRIKEVKDGSGLTLKFPDEDVSDIAITTHQGVATKPTFQGNAQQDQGTTTSENSSIEASSDKNGHDEQVPSVDCKGPAALASDYAFNMVERLRDKAKSVGFRLVLLSDQDIANELGALSAEQHVSKEDEILNKFERESLDTLATKCGKIILSNVEYEKLSNFSITEVNVEHEASKFGLIALPISIYEQMISKEAINEKYIHEEASKMGLRVFSDSELKSFESQLEEKTLKLEKIQDKAQELGYVLLSKELMDELQNLKNSQFATDHHEEDLSEIEQLARDEFSTPEENLSQDVDSSAANINTIKEIISAKSTDEPNSQVSSAMSLKEEDNQEESCISKNGKNKNAQAYSLTVEQLIEQAQKRKLIVLNEGEYEAILEEQTMSEKNIKSYAKELGLAVVDEKHYQDLKSQAELSEDQIIDIAAQHDLVTLNMKEYKNLKEHPVIKKEQLFEQARHFGLKVLDEMQYEDLKHHPPMTKEELISYTRQYDLVAISCEDYKNLKKPPVLSKEQITKQAKDNEMVTISREDYEILKTSSQGKKTAYMNNSKTAFEPNEYFSEFVDMAMKNGVLKTSNGKPLVMPISPRDIVILPKSYYNDLTAVRVEDHYRPLVQGTKEKFHPRVSPRLPKSESQPIQSVKRTDEAKKKLASTVPQGDSDRLQYSPTSNGTSMKRTLRKPNHPHSTGIIPGSSEVGSDLLDNTSLASEASLRESSIIPALTQTVIGEYLYKYYRVFGIESRHERFFWIHPYTLTLYWSTTNPVLENKSTTQRTRSAAILGVESVTDSNPYPAGLYHKSLIITSNHKVIKLTCPTRKRHNIWYNSLRYLLQRSLEGINLEDIADDPNDHMYSGKVFLLPNETSNLNSNTFSSFKRLSSSKRSTKDLAPRSPSMPIRKR